MNETTRIDRTDELVLFLKNRQSSLGSSKESAYNDYAWEGYDECCSLIKHQAKEITKLNESFNEALESLKHLHYNAKKSGVNMGLALDFAKEILNKNH